MEPVGKEGNDSRTCAGDGTGGKGGEATAAPVCGGWSRREREGATVVVRRGLDRRRHQPKGRSPAPGTESPMPRWQCADGTLVPAWHKIQASRKGSGSADRVAQATRDFCCLILQLERSARSRRAPSPHPPARHSDGRHPAPVSRRRGRTPEAERSPIGIRSDYVRAGPPSCDRGGEVPGCWCGERQALARPSGKLRVPPAVSVGGAALFNLRSQNGR